MWIVDHAAQEIVWTTEDLYASDFGFEHEDEGWWSDELDFESEYFDGAFCE